MTSFTSDLAALLPSISDLELLPHSLFQDLSPHPYYDLHDSTLLLSHHAIPRIHQEATSTPNYHSVALLLLINGENHSLWTIIRSTFDAFRLSMDLSLTKLVLKKHRKASCAWDYRLFLMSQGGFSYLTEAVFLQEIIDREQQHYYAWLYRMKLMQRYMTQREREQDWDNMWSHCEGHISDCSAWHYVGTLTLVLGREREAVERLKAICEVYYGVDGLYTVEKNYGMESISRLLIRLKCDPMWLNDFLRASNRPLSPTLTAALKQSSVAPYPSYSLSHVPSTL